MLTGQPISLCSRLGHSFSTHLIILSYIQPLLLSSASFSPPPLHTFHTIFFNTFICLCVFSFTGCLVMFSTSLLRFLTRFAFSVAHSPSLSLSVSDSCRNGCTCKTGTGVLLGQLRSQLCKQYHVPASVCIYVKGIPPDHINEVKCGNGKNKIS